MSLKQYFTDLLAKVEKSEDITNAGKDENGFYKPTRSVLIQKLNLLRDLHGKPQAREMVKAAWATVVAELPPEWLVLGDDDKAELKRVLGG